MKCKYKIGVFGAVVGAIAWFSLLTMRIPILSDILYYLTLSPFIDTFTSAGSGIFIGFALSATCFAIYAFILCKLFTKR